MPGQLVASLKIRPYLWLFSIMKRARARRLPAAFVRVLLTITIVLGSIPIPARTAYAASVPLVSLSVPSEVMLGESLSFTVTFENASAIDPGFGPYIDLFLPTTGIDGGAAFDGISFASATFLGAPVTATTVALTTGGINHPYAKTAAGTPVVVTPPSGFQAGDQLVVLQLPFGSFTPGQTPAQLDITASVSNQADVGATHSVAARGGFRYGNTPADDPTTDPSVIGALSTNTVKPTLMKLTKSYLGPEDETTTGPNFPRQYRVAVDIANGQQITLLTLKDVLPTTFQYVSLDATLVQGGSVSTTSVNTPSTGSPGGILERRFPTVTGTTSQSDVEMVFSFYVPYADGSTPILDPNSGNDTSSINDASAAGKWLPVDPRDRGPGGLEINVASNVTAVDHILNDRSIATQKSVTVITDTGAAGPTPGDTLEYAIAVQVSDFFVFQSVVLTDVISDGQRYDATFAPLLQMDGNGFSLSSASFNGSNVVVTPNYTGASTAPNDGTTSIEFRISDELISRGQPDGRLIGGCVPTSGTGGTPPSCTSFNDGATIAVVKFRSVIQNLFTDTYPSGDPSVDHNDVISDTTMVGGALLSVIDASTPTGQTEEDVSSALVTIVEGVASKSIYKINGQNPSGPPYRLAAGDVVTFRMRYTLPISSTEHLKFTDYLPLPVFDAMSVSTSFSTTIDTNAPAAGQTKFGPAETFFPISGQAPSVTRSATDNAVTFDFGNFDDTLNRASEVDVLMSVQVTSAVFADGLFLTNQVTVEENNTILALNEANAIIQVQITEPLLTLRKGIVATNRTAAPFSPSTVGPVSFNAPGTAGNRWTGTINSSGLASTPINSSLGGVDAGDLVTFAIAVENTGSGLNGAFDVRIRDAMPAGFGIPGSGLNLRAADGTGAAINVTPIGIGLFDPVGGIDLDDPGPTATPAGSIDDFNATSGRNIAIITYDLELTGSVSPGQVLTNTATLFHFASAEGGADFSLADLTDTASVTVASSQSSKQVTLTSETATSGNDVTIGEVVTFRVTVTVPEATLTNAQLVDTLPAGLAFLDIQSITPSGSLSTSVAGGFAQVLTNAQSSLNVSTATFNFGTLSNSDVDNSTNETIIIDYRVVVLNASGNDRGIGRTNGVSFTSTSSPTVTSSTTVTIVEPTLQIAKSASPTSNVDAGDTITYTVTVSHTTPSNVAAFDVTLTDTVPAGLTVTGVAHTGGLAPDSAPSFVGNLVTANYANLPRTGTNTSVIQITATVNGSVNPGQSIANAATVVWSSLPGNVSTPQTSFSGISTERTGNTTDPGGSENDYSATSPAANITIGSTSTVKAPTASSETFTAGNNVAIGEVITYQVTITIPETTLPGSQLTDTLPTGLAFVAIDSLVASPSISTSNLNGFGPGAGSVLDTAQAGLTAGAATFNFGTLTNTDSNNGTNETIVITYRVVVLNHVNNVRGQTRTNSASFTSTNSPAANASATALTIVEPTLQLGKTVSPLTTVDAGDTITYTLTVNNSAPSNTSAFDVVLTDTIPSPLQLASATLQSGVTPTSLSTAGSTVTVHYDALALGETSTISITATVPVTVNPGQVIANTAGVTWTSLPSDAPPIPASSFSAISTERTGSTSGPGTTANTYTATSPAASITIGLSQATKLVTLTSETSTTNPNIGIGEIITYQVTVTVPEGTLPNAHILDTLPAGLAILSLDGLTASAALTTSTAGFPAALSAAQAALATPGSTFDVNLGTLTNTDTNNSTSETIALTYRVVVLNASGNDRGTGLTNSVRFTSQNSADVTASASTLTIVEPTLQIAKSVSPTSSVDAGDTLTYTLNISHTGASNAGAFNVTVADVLPSELSYVSGTRTAGVTPTSINHTTGTVAVTFDSFPHGSTSTIEIVTTVNVSAAAGQTISNSAAMTWTSLPNNVTTAQSAHNALSTERTGNPADPGGAQNDYTSSSPAASVVVSGSQAAKIVTLTSQNFTAGNNVAIGEQVTYAVTVTMPEGTIPGAQLIDTLPAGLAFVSLDALSASPALSVSGGFASILNTARTNFTANQATFNFGTVINSDVVNGTPETIVATYTVVVLNDTINVRGQTRTNNAAFTSTGGTPVNTAAPALTIVEPKLRLMKSVTPPSPRVGDTITYTITVDHEAPPSNTHAYNAVITDVLPAAVTYGSMSHTAGSAPTSLTQVGGTVTATFADFLGGSSSTLQIIGTVNSSTNGGQIVTNPARVRWSSLPGDVTAPQSTKSAISTERTGDTADPGTAANTYEATGSAQITVATEQPSIGLAKSAGAPINNNDGTFTVPFTFSVENLGDVALTNVQVTDDLASAFSGATGFNIVGGTMAATGTLTVSSGFTGTTPNTNLLNSANSSLTVGATHTITFSVRVTPGSNLGPFSNTATASGVSPDLASVTDTSDNGTNPDPDGDNNANEPGENDPTPISFTESPAIGIAKAVGTVVNNFDGSFTVPFTLTLTNLGDVPVTNIQVTDDLDAAFSGATSFLLVPGSTSATGSLTANPSFNGSGANRGLLLPGSSTLAVNASHSVSFSVRVTPGVNLGPYLNQATATASGPAGQSITDLSDNGANPDSDGDRNGNEAGENDPTPVSFVLSPAIGLAKAIGAVVNNSDGTFTVPYTLTVKNLGDLNISSVQVVDNLAATFGSATGFQVMPGSLTASGTLNANTAYSGSGANTSLLIAASSTLPRGATETIGFSVRVTPGSTPGPYFNTATVTGQAANATSVQDISDNGANPDPDGDGNGDEPGENDPTPVSFTALPAIGLAKAAGTAVNNGDGSFTVPFTFAVQNLGELHLSEIQIVDPLANTFASATSFQIVSGSLIATGTLTANPGFTGSGNNTHLLVASSSTLPRGATETVSFSLKVIPGAHLGPYLNSASVQARAANGATVADTSDDGSNPDTDGDGNANEPGENDPTPISFTQRLAIGIAKSSGTIVNNADGSFTVPYSLKVANLGDVSLSNVQVTDDLNTTFGGATAFAVVPGSLSATGSLAVQPSFTGISPNITLLNSAQSSLAVGATQTINLLVRVTPGVNLGPYNNQATATGTSPAGQIVTDQSDNGTSPDPDGDGNANEPGENDPTPVSFSERPSLGIAKAVSAVVNNGDGSYTATYIFTVRNLGDVPVRNIQIVDNFNAAYSGALQWTLVPGSAQASGSLTVDAAGFRKSPAEILVPASSWLASGATGTVTSQIQIWPGSNLGPYTNVAIVSGVGSGGQTVTDTSDNGLDPDPDQDLNPDEPGENDPTPLQLNERPVIGLAKSVGALTDNGDGSFNVPYTVTIRNLGNVALTGVQVSDDLSAAFRSPSQFALVMGSLTASGNLAVNAAYRGIAPDSSLLVASNSRLAINETQTIRFTIRVTPGTAPGPYQNSATAGAVSPAGAVVSDVSHNGLAPDPDGDGNPSEPGESDPTPIVFQVDADLEIKKSTSASIVNTGDSLVYTLEVINHGPVSTQGVRVVDNLPPEVTAGTVTTTMGACLLAARTITCELGMMDRGQKALITIPTVVGLAPESIINSASVQGLQPDLNITNNTATARTRVTNIIVGEDKPNQRKLTETERQQAQRTNRSGLDDYRTEGNLVLSSCDDERREPFQDPFIPYAVIATRDGEQRLLLLHDTRHQCRQMKDGDYLEADGVKLNEQLFETENVTIRRNGSVVQ
ncbi:MAG: beta strand repeat-containing protein [Chloroflexota bacterium]